MRVLSRWSRRRFLQAAGVGAAAGALAPFVPTLTASAGGTAGPTRLVLFMAPMASTIGEWRANGAGSPFASGSALPATLAGRILSPLDGLQERLVYLDGLDIQTAFETPTSRICHISHECIQSLWTNTQPTPAGPLPDTDSSGCIDLYGTATGPSLDQIIHRRLREETPRLRSFQLSCTQPYSGQADARNVASYGFPAAGDPAAPLLFPIPDPRNAFDQIFAGVGPTTDTRRGLERRRVLDLVRGEMTRLRAELPAEDRDRLDQHHQSIVDLDARLTESSAACVPPDAPASLALSYRRANPLEIARMQYELVRIAFECDIARVVSFCLGAETQGGPASVWDPSLPSVGNMHEASHETHIEANRNLMITFNRAQVASFAELVRTLQTGSDVMRDTIAVYGSCMSDSNSHTQRNPPFLIAAGEGTPIRTNQYRRWGTYTGTGRAYAGGIPHARLLTSLGQAMGLSDMTTIGDARVEADPIPELFR